MTRSTPIRVLVVDDSPTTVAVLKKMLSSSEDITVVGTAANGADGLRQVEALKPDVICSDYNMPEMNGLEFTRAVMKEYPRPILVVSTEVADRSSKTVFELLKAGAIDVFPKPRGGISPENDELRRELVRKIKVLSGIVVFHKYHHPERQAAGTKPAARPLPAPGKDGRYRIVALGSSTGGPQALLSILPRLPADFPIPVVCVQHISTGFLAGLLEWLNEHCALSVGQAPPGQLPARGHIYFPPEGHHLTFANDGTFVNSNDPPYRGNRPSVNVTFASIAGVYAAQAIGILLTGMGDDGAEGMGQLKGLGAPTIAQDEASSTVFGMPRAAIEQGAATEVLGLEKIAARILKLTGRSG